MRRSHGAVLAVLLVASAVGASPPEGKRQPRLPGGPVAPPPADTPVILPEGVEYVIDHDSPCIVRSFPKSRLAVEAIVLAKGETLLLPGHFIDGEKRETRKFVGPLYVYRVSAAETGPCELMVLPVGGTEADMIVRPIVARVGPRPPPKPDPDPKPPTPDPKPPAPDPKPVDPPPIPAAGLHVLVVFETGKALPPGQQSILYGKAVRDYLQANCVVGPDGKTKQFRIYDQDVDASRDSKLWADAMKRPRASVPWVVVSNGKTGFEGPLPENPDKFLELVRKYVP